MNKLIKLALVALVLISTQATAAVRCPAAKFKELYPSGEQVFIKLKGQTWHLLGNKSDPDIQEKVDKVMKAKEKKKLIELRFPNGYDETCKTADTTVAVKRVKLYNKKKYKEKLKEQG